MGSDAMILVFWMLSFKPIFSLSSFARVQPQWIQGNSKRRQHGEEKLICWKPVWGIPPVTRSWGRKLTYARRAQTSGTPLEIPKHVPQKNLPVFVLCFSTLLIFSGKSQFRALVFCIWKSVSIQKPSDGFLACLQDSYSCACDCLRPPDRRRHRKLKTS